MDEDDLFGRWRKRRPFFPDFFPNIERTMREFDKAFEEMTKDLQKTVPKNLVNEKQLPGGGRSKHMGPFVYGYSVHIGPDGRPIVRHFGNVRATSRGKSGLEISDQREPLIDVVDEGGAIRVVAEVPGVDKRQIHLECTKDSLTISVNSSSKYYKTLDLPSTVKPTSAKASYRNGTLEVRIQKITPTQPDGHQISIE
ncbi:MAG: heat-shock protein Hsp20 [Chloroflexi bacterium]|nr:heat-shock protein Hsp20 [Chloroflexota bacterium]